MKQHKALYMFQRSLAVVGMLFALVALSATPSLANLSDLITAIDGVQNPVLITINSGPSGGRWPITISGAGSLDGTYDGWCADPDDPFNFGQQYQANMSVGLDPPWSYVNYIASNFQVGDPSPSGGTYSICDLQQAFHHFIAGFSHCTQDITQSHIDEIINAANANGADFVPGCGDKVAVFLEPLVDGVQAQFILFSLTEPDCQVCSGTIGDFVWRDSNANGMQDSGEPGIPNVTVNLYDASGNKIASTVTDQNGFYLFNGLCAGDYTVAVDQTTVPAGLAQTICSNQAGVGNNSNCSPSPVTLPTDNSSDLTIDFGYVATKSALIGPSTMEGAIKISNGDWVNGGYSLKSNVTGNLIVMAQVTITGKCSNGGTDTVTVPLATKMFHNPSIAKDWLPTGDANSVLSWQGSVQVGVTAPAVCGGVGKLDASKGAVFTSTFFASPPEPGALVTFRFKFRDPAAKGKPNTNCLDTSDPNRNKADVCGASWSATKTFDP